jgi:hypothetical protein
LKSSSREFQFLVDFASPGHAYVELEVVEMCLGSSSRKWEISKQRKNILELLPSEKGDPSNIFVKFFFEVEIMMDSSGRGMAEPKFDR